MTADVVFLIDVDNTLLDNDRVIADLHAHLDDAFGPASAARYWAGFEAMRDERGYVDYLGALQRYRAVVEADGGGDDAAQKLLRISTFLIDYPFPERRLPAGAFDVARRDRAGSGPPSILSDGDVVFQPRKIHALRPVGRGARAAC